MESSTPPSREAIVVAGYPKSGNTWVTRLVAELTGCPVAGFWGEPDYDEIAVEGTGRQSPFEVYKSHHPWETLRARVPVDRCIVVVRDPRAIAASGAAYFRRLPRTPLERRIVLSRPLGRIYSWFTLNPPVGRKDRMIRFMVRGLADPHLWLTVPWDRHVEPFLSSGAVIVRYEDLLADPQPQCGRILEHLGFERSAAEVRAAIEAQSFDAKKRAFEAARQPAKADFLRRGEADGWRRELSARQADRIERAFARTMDRLGYR